MWSAVPAPRTTQSLVSWSVSCTECVRFATGVNGTELGVRPLSAVRGQSKWLTEHRFNHGDLGPFRRLYSFAQDDASGMCHFLYRRAAGTVRGPRTVPVHDGTLSMPLYCTPSPSAPPPPQGPNISRVRHAIMVLQRSSHCGLGPCNVLFGLEDGSTPFGMLRAGVHGSVFVNMGPQKWGHQQSGVNSGLP